MVPRTIQVLLLPPTIFVIYIVVVLKLQGQIGFDSVRSKDILMQGFEFQSCLFVSRQIIII